MFFDQTDPVLATSIFIGTLMLIASFGLALRRIVRGPSAFDRVVALDLIGGLCLCIIVLLAIYFEQPVLLDSAFAIAVVSFIATVAFARYLGKGGD